MTTVLCQRQFQRCPQVSCGSQLEHHTQKRFDCITRQRTLLYIHLMTHPMDMSCYVRLQDARKNLRAILLQPGSRKGKPATSQRVSTPYLRTLAPTKSTEHPSSSQRVQVPKHDCTRSQQSIPTMADIVGPYTIIFRYLDPLRSTLDDRDPASPYRCILVLYYRNSYGSRIQGLYKVMQDFYHQQSLDDQLT